MWEKVNNPRTISLVVNNEEYEEFKKLLPRDTTVGEYIRKVMREEVELQKKEEALNSPNYSPVREPIIYNKEETIKHNSTLDIYLLEKRDIVKYIDKIDDVPTLAKIEEKSYVFYSVAKTRKKERLPLYKLQNEVKSK
jgi:hypothetical protein